MTSTPDWAGGYPTAQRYLDTVQSGTSPVTLDLGLVVRGFLPPTDAPDFRYAELGCGSAFSLIALAALNPQAQFCGYDFMPEHVARARGLIGEAGLTNITVDEASFADLAASPTPNAFDYIVLHGVWTWVSDENRQHLTDILGRWLKPGGAAVIGYACAAGWAEAEPIRRIFRKSPRGPDDAPYKHARAAVDAWAKSAGSASAVAFWEKIRDLPDRYITHDLGAEHGSAVWHDDLAETLHAAKLGYVCPTGLADQFDALQFDSANMAFVKQGVAEGWGELARDIAAKRTFRSDVFTKGAPRMSALEMNRRLRSVRIAAWPPLLTQEKEAASAEALKQFEPTLQEKIDTAMSSDVSTIGAFADALDLDETKALQTVLLLLARHQLRVVRAPHEVAACRDSTDRLHKALTRRWCEDLSVPGVASAVTGGPVQLSAAEKDALFKSEPSDVMVRQGLERLGVTVQS